MFSSSAANQLLIANDRVVPQKDAQKKDVPCFRMFEINLLHDLLKILQKCCAPDLSSNSETTFCAPLLCISCFPNITRAIPRRIHLMLLIFL